MGAIAQRLQVVPTTPSVYRTANLVLHPPRDLWPAPEPTVIRALLQGLVQLLVLRRREPGRCTWQAPAMITDGLFPCLMVAPHDRANPARAGAYPLSHFGGGVALLHQPHHVPMRSFAWIGRFARAFVKLFCCQLGFHFDSFGHASIIRYLIGFDMSSWSSPCTALFSRRGQVSSFSQTQLGSQCIIDRLPESATPPRMIIVRNGAIRWEIARQIPPGAAIPIKTRKWH